MSHWASLLCLSRQLFDAKVDSTTCSLQVFFECMRVVSWSLRPCISWCWQIWDIAWCLTPSLPDCSYGIHAFAIFLFGMAPMVQSMARWYDAIDRNVCSVADSNVVYTFCKAGFFKLWVVTHKWVPEPSHVGCEKVSCKNITVTSGLVCSQNNAGIILLDLNGDFFKNNVRSTISNHRNRKLEISTAPTKAKSQEPAYLQALIQNKIVRQRVRSRDSSRQTVRWLWCLVFRIEMGREVGRSLRTCFMNQCSSCCWRTE